MKVKIKYQYPYTATHEGEAVIEIPDDANPEEWIEDNEYKILEEQGAELDGLEYAFDMGYAKVTIISGIIPSELFRGF